MSIIDIYSLGVIFNIVSILMWGIITFLLVLLFGEKESLKEINKRLGIEMKKINKTKYRINIVLMIFFPFLFTYYFFFKIFILLFSRGTVQEKITNAQLISWKNFIINIHN